MLAKYRIEIKYGLVTLALLEALVVLERTHALSGLNPIIDDLFDRLSGLGFVGIFIVALLGNAMLLVYVPYTMPLLCLALGGTSLNRMLLMGLASGLGAASGEIISYSITLKILGENPALQRSSLLQWAKYMVNSHPRMMPLLLFVWVALPLPSDILIIPLAMVRYGVKPMLPSLFTGKVVQNLAIATIFYYLTSWSAAHVSSTVQGNLAPGLLIVFVMIILYQAEKTRTIKRPLAVETQP